MLAFEPISVKNVFNTDEIKAHDRLGGGLIDAVLLSYAAGLVMKEGK